jgi:abortive infection bacteriophage resistance protein
MNYSEPLLTISDVMNLLDNRGISYDDKQKAEDTLRNMSLFRLKGYLYPFEQDHATHLLKSGTTFEKVLKLHDFDVALRALISQWLQKIEVSLRTQMSQVMAEATD